MKKSALSLFVVMMLVFVGCASEGNVQAENNTLQAEHDSMGQAQGSQMEESVQDRGDYEHSTGFNEMEDIDDTDNIVNQLVRIGFTENEALEMEEIFLNVGLYEIGEIRTATGTGIDHLQAFIAPVFGSKQLQVNFTVENRTLCWVELAGIPDHKTKIYVNRFGKLDTKEELTMTSITLFDRWEADGETYKSTQDSYIAKLDYENWTLVEISDNAIG